MRNLTTAPRSHWKESILSAISRKRCFFGRDQGQKCFLGPSLIEIRRNRVSQSAEICVSKWKSIKLEVNEIEKFDFRGKNCERFFEVRFSKWGTVSIFLFYGSWIADPFLFFRIGSFSNESGSRSCPTLMEIERNIERQVSWQVEIIENV